MGLFKSLKVAVSGLNDGRRAPRVSGPVVTVYFWNGGEPVPHRLRDVSLTGAYLYTSERWYLGTTLQMTIEACTENNGNKPAGENTITLWSKVVRHGPDGVGLDFIFAKRARELEFKRFLAHIEENLT